MIEDRFQKKDVMKKYNMVRYDVRNMGMCKQQPIIELDNFEETTGNEPKSDPYDRQYTIEQIERFGAELTANKCHILDCVMETIPEHLKAQNQAYL